VSRSVIVLLLVAACLNSRFASAQNQIPSAIQRDVYGAVLKSVAGNGQPSNVLVSETTIEIPTIARRFDSWRAEFAVLPPELKTALEARRWTSGDRIPADRLPSGAGILSHEALAQLQATPPADDVSKNLRTRSSDATGWLSLSAVLVNTSQTNALVYYRYVDYSGRRDGRDAYAWLVRGDEAGPWKIAGTVTDWNDWKSRPWTELNDDEIAVLDACLTTYNSYKSRATITILRSYRGVGAGLEMIDVVTIETPPAIRKKLARTPKTMASASEPPLMFVGRVSLDSNASATMPIEMGEVHGGFCRAYRGRWSSWKVDGPIIRD
jgi:hypothetical protein